MIRSEGATAALVPPIYAIRPIILLLIILGVQAAGVADWLATSGIAPAAANLSVEHNEGWFAGAIMAGAAAIAIWIVSVQDIKRRRARTSRINQGPGS
jgi:Na+/melibiose symporter-like transporter